MELLSKLWIILFLIGGYSAGDINKAFKTDQSGTNSVIGLNLISIFPTRPMSATWIIPSKSDDTIVQYVTIVRTNNTNQTCVLWAQFNCSDCGNRAAGSKGYDTVIDKCLKYDYSDTFLKSMSSLEETIRHDNIRPNTDYNVTIFPVYAHGWGDPASKSIKTGPFFSGAVRNVKVYSQFPQYPLNVKWVMPEYPNGEVLEYEINIMDQSSYSCILKLTLKCRDCWKKTPGNKGSENLVRCLTSTIYNHPFSRNDANVTIYIDHYSIRPSSEYNVVVVPRNEYGWGNRANASIQTGPYVSGAVGNLTMVSIYPSSPMLLTWVPPQFSNGEIKQYIVMVRDTIRSVCVLWLSVDCSDCANKIIGPNGDPGFRQGCRNATSNNIFSKGQRMISITIVDPSIKSYSEYEVSVVALNEFGWGNTSSVTNWTGQYTSGMVYDLALGSSFPGSRISVRWGVPRQPNGRITQYIITVEEESTKKCILWLSISCVDCNAISGENGSKNLTIQCESMKVHNQTFDVNQTAFRVDLPYSEINTFTRYIVSVIPINGYGWGNGSTSALMTGDYVSDPVRNLTLTSQFPYDPLIIKWNSPNKPSGIILQYAIIIGNNNTCIMWWTINCSDCGNYAPGNNSYDHVTSACLEVKNDRKFTAYQTDFVANASFEGILPYTEVKVTVIPINRYIWGDKLDKTIKTSQYKSDRVNNLTLDSNFPRDNLVLTWRIPTNPRGQILTYSIFIYENSVNTCLASLNTTCIDCESSAVSTSDGSRTVQCPIIFSRRQFNKNNDTISINITDPIIQPQLNLTVSIVPLNGYGWGDSIFQSTTTPSYVPLNVSTFLSVVNDSNILLYWSRPSEDIFKYSYNLNMSSQFQNNSIILPSSQTNFNVNNGLFCTLYQFCIWTSTPYGNGRTSCLTNITGLSLITITTPKLNTTNNTINVNWTFSDEQSCKIGFLIMWNGGGDSSNITTSSNSVLISSLKYYHVYEITVIPFSTMNNMKRWGNKKISTITTEIGNPSIVRGFTCVNTTFNSFNCSWIQPQEINGPTVTYFLKCANETVIQSTTVTTLFAVISERVYPDINYTCSIKANTSVGWGDTVTTSINIVSSSVPGIVDVSKISEVMKTSSERPSTSKIPVTLPYSHFTESLGRIVKFSIVLGVNRGTVSKDLNNSISKTYDECSKGSKCPYEIELSFPTSELRKKREILSRKWANKVYFVGSAENCDTPNGQMCNGPLDFNTEYIIGFRAYTINGFITVGFIIMSTAYNYSPIFIIIGVLLFLLLGIAIVAFVIYRRRRPPRYSDRTISFKRESVIHDPSPEISDFEEYYRYISKDSYAPAIDQFADLHKISKELENSHQIDFIDGNETKNRYKNIKPYKHNPIKLKCSDPYINASRICPKHYSTNIENQCFCRNFYIATQGPLGHNAENKQSTIGDFWRMAVEYDISVIVNLTKCIESFKEKCSQYWPETVNKQETYVTGDQSINVTLQTQDSGDIFSERVFLVEMSGEKRTMTQLHFEAWNDHSSPDVHDFLKFYDRFTTLQQGEKTVVVHCSAGVGRTGTFILIDIELRKIVSHQYKIEIYNTVLNLRRCRCFMVQAEKQYIFVHDIIYEYLKQNGLLSEKAKSHNKTSYLNPAFE